LTSERYTQYPVEDKPRGRWKKIALWTAVALVLIVVLVAAGSYLWFRAQVSSANQRVTPEVRAALEQKPATSLTTTPTAGPAGGNATTTALAPSPSAMNLLVIGSDRRSDGPSIGGRSDTLMIVHIDPERDYLSVLSLPRDLRVEIPGHGKGKLNTAFGSGGPALAIQTIELATGVDINHYLEVGFDAFTEIVDSLGGVYVDVDKRYYNPEYYYEPINIFPGYQLLNGADALDYVRYRHDSNMDFGRMDRQQQFMSALREQAMGWDLPFKMPGVISALFRNATTDLSANDFLRLAKWGVGLSGDGIRGITLKGDTPTIGGASYVVVTENEMARAVDRLLYKSASDAASATVVSTSSTTSSPTSTTKRPGDLTGVTVDVTGANGRGGEADAAAKWLRSLKATVTSNSDQTGDALDKSVVEYPSGLAGEADKVASATGVADTKRTSKVVRVTLLLGKDFVLPAAFSLPGTPETVPDSSWWKYWAPQVSYAVRAPGYLPAGYHLVRRFPDNYATYGIKGGGGEQPAFRMMYASADSDDQVMGITETTWLNAPAATKGLEVTHNGVVFTVVRNDTKVERVWFKADGVLYFVSNTLSHWLDQDEMLGIAESMIAIPR
jgi:polyisoprenyl-teichoic acid--peptidoglycan teichoic acid transferase